MNDKYVVEPQPKFCCLHCNHCKPHLLNSLFALNWMSTSTEQKKKREHMALKMLFTCPFVLPFSTFFGFLFFVFSVCFFVSTFQQMLNFQSISSAHQFFFAIQDQRNRIFFHIFVKITQSIFSHTTSCDFFSNGFLFCFYFSHVKSL